MSQSKPQIVLTHNAIAKFMSCERKFKLRHLNEIVPIRRFAPGLTLEDLITKALRMFYTFKDKKDSFDYLKSTWRENPQNDSYIRECQKDTITSLAMLDGYLKLYSNDMDWALWNSNVGFTLPITNPKTNSRSKRFLMGGVIPLIIRSETSNLKWLWNIHLTSDSSETYVERLWHNIESYCLALYANEIQPEGIEGIVHDIIYKSHLEWREDETDVHFQARKEALARNNKSGKSSATQQKGESAQEYYQRLKEKYQSPTMFRREVILLDQDKISEIKEVIWGITQRMLVAMREGVFIPNYNNCISYGKTCPYWKLCSNNLSPFVQDANYEYKPANDELITPALETK